MMGGCWVSACEKSRPVYNRPVAKCLSSWLSLAALAAVCALVCSDTLPKYISRVSRSGQDLFVEFDPGYQVVTNVDLVTNLKPFPGLTTFTSHTEYTEWLVANSDERLFDSEQSADVLAQPVLVSIGESPPDYSTTYWLVAYGTQGKRIWMYEAVDVTGVVQYGRTYNAKPINPLYIALAAWLLGGGLLIAIALVVLRRIRLKAALAAMPKQEAEEEVDLDEYGVVRHTAEKKPIIVRIQPPKDE
jgi:hypothetical protein